MAIAAVLCAIGLRMSVDRVFEDRYAFVTFYLAILLAAWLGGMGPAITACVLGWLAGFLFFRPEPSILNLPPAVMLGSLFYFIVGFTVALIAGRMHDLRDRAERLAQRVGDRNVALQDEVERQRRELERAMSRLHFSDRVSLLGMLAAGIGHDAGNLLFPIRNRLDSLESAARHGHVNEEDFKTIRAAANYLQLLCRNIMQVAADPSAAAPEAQTDLINWCQENLPLLKLSLPRGVKLVAPIRGDLPPVRIAPHALSQVALNLVHNAGKAMAGRGRGQITLAASFDAETNRVQFSVSDDGPGIAPAVLSRLQHSTAEPPTAASGMGLALVRTIVQSVGGQLTISSPPNAGTVVRVDLPAVKHAAPVGHMP